MIKYALGILLLKFFDDAINAKKIKLNTKSPVICQGYLFVNLAKKNPIIKGNKNTAPPIT